MKTSQQLPGPVFVHAWWRSSSTYLWSKLRQNQSLCCFYEPLNERISSLNLAQIEAGPEVDLTNALRHPHTEQHYFAEYANLLRSGSLQYSKRLAYSDYLLRPSDPDEELRRYLGGLIKSARSDHRRPVLCFCRSQMRSAWMKQEFRGLHIGQVRNPFDQWRSFQVHPYFQNALITLALNLRAKYPTIFEHLPDFDLQVGKTMQGGRCNFDPTKIMINPDDIFSIFLLIWIASTIQILSVCDYILDVDRLSVCPGYRKETEEWFSLQGCPVNLSDCVTPGTSQPHRLSSGVSQQIINATKALGRNAAELLISQPEVVKTRTPNLSPQSQVVIEMSLVGG